MECKECKKKDEIIQSQKNMVSGFLHGIGNTILPDQLLKTAKNIVEEGEERYQIGLECVAIMQAQKKQIDGLQEFIDNILAISGIEIEGFFEKGERIQKINNISSEEFIKLHNTEKDNDTNQQVP